MMTPDLRDLIAGSPYVQATVPKVAQLLPGDDALLDALMAELVAQCEDIEFVICVQAALHAGRTVQGRHLARGAMLLPDKWTLGAFACQMQGEVAGALLWAISETVLPHPLMASAVFLAMHFHLEQKSGVHLPGSLLTCARKAARDPQNTNYEKTLLFAVATMGGDPGLMELVLQHDEGKKMDDPRMKDWEEGAKKLGEQMLTIWRHPAFDLVPKEVRRTVAEGNTMRRAVARTGRNEKCPCGSGKKYKQCCMEKDAELLHHSTAIAGVTTMELRANPERYLTSQELNETSAVEAARFDPHKIPPEMRENYLAALCRGKMFERCAEAMEIFGFSAELEEAWDNISLRMAQGRRKDLVERMLKLRPDALESKNQALQLFFLEDNPAKLHEHITSGAMIFLQEEKDPVAMMGFARALLNSRLCAMGILVTRGLLPLLPREQASQFLKEMLEARDKLTLGPEDPISEVLDRLSLEQRTGTGREAAALREVQQRLNDKLLETRRYRENVERLEKELTHREQLAASAKPSTFTESAAGPAASAPATSAGDAGLAELRQKVGQLRTALKERHSERNALRRELDEAHAALDTMRQPAPANAGNGEPGEASHEEDLLLPQEDGSTHPVRTIEFPKDFREKLASLPKSVARGTMTTLGRMAAGEASAFVGAVRLKACPDITRQRIGIDFRLLVRLLPDRVQVVDLIPRQDLERRIKTLV